MDGADFEDALARALHGEVLTDLRPSPGLLEALLRVAAATTPAARRAAMRAARAVHDRERRDPLDEVDDRALDPDEDPEPW